MDWSVGIIMLLVMLSLGAPLFAWHFHRSRSLLERWAERGGYRIIDAEYRNVFRGPFF
jgi:hypothetical protein